MISRLVGRRALSSTRSRGTIRLRFAAALSLIGTVALGCAGAMGPLVPPAAPSATHSPSEAYPADVAALAREARALVQEAAKERAGTIGGCGTDTESAYDEAIYDAAEPLASMMTLVEAEDLCNKDHIQCYRNCMRVKPPWPRDKNSPSHKAYCSEKCLKEYVECMKKAGLMKEFSVMEAATEWIKRHSKEIVIGTLVVIGAVVYVVATGSGGALTLILLPAVE